jgi:hypothetical protein
MGNIQKLYANIPADLGCLEGPGGNSLRIPKDDSYKDSMVLEI